MIATIVMRAKFPGIQRAITKALQGDEIFTSACGLDESSGHHLITAYDTADRWAASIPRYRERWDDRDGLD
jgi:hypothetical protein